MYNVLFVCSQNMCRSPYCEYMFRKMVEDSDVLRGKVDVKSSAVMSPVPYIDPKTAEALIREGFDEAYVNSHKPGFILRPYDIKLFKNADIIIGMTKGHKLLTPIWWQGKFKTLSEAATGRYKPVPDPWLIKDIDKYIGEMNKIKAYLEQYVTVLEEELK